MSTMIGLFTISLFLASEMQGVVATPLTDLEQRNTWPAQGFQYCSFIKHKETTAACVKCFTNAKTNWIKIRNCVKTLLPHKFAVCAGKKSTIDFRVCLVNARVKQIQENQRANYIYEHGSTYLHRVGKSKIIPYGGETMFSCFSQDLLLGCKSLQPALEKDCSSCFTKFQMDPINQMWHLSSSDGPKPHQHRPNSNGRDSMTISEEAKKMRDSVKDSTKDTKEDSNRTGERILVYEYGYVGHDMPFHGIGPFATDILKGECIYNKLAEGADLDALVSAILNSDYPVASWIFRELLNNIGSVNFP